MPTQTNHPFYDDTLQNNAILRTVSRFGVYLAATAVALTSAVAPLIASGAAVAADMPTLPAIPADSLVDAYGIGIHLAFLDTPYRNATVVANALTDLGVRHVRDDLYLRNPRQYAGIATVASRGIRFNLITGSPTGPEGPEAYVHTIATRLPPGAVESIEGTNEWDHFSRGAGDWAQALVEHQKALYSAVKAEPATAALAVLSPSLAFKRNYTALPDLSAYTDVANAHMYPGGHAPSKETYAISTALRKVIPAKPMVVTEAGYHNAISTTNGHLPVPEDVAAVYMPRLLLEHYWAGRSRVYSYELIDEFHDPGKTNPEASFGLLRNDLSPKPAYLAMKNLLSLVHDPGPAFAPQTLPIRISGFPVDGRYIVTQKRNGSYVVLMWRDVSVYDPVQRTPRLVTPTPVGIRLGRMSRVSVHRPSVSPAPIAVSDTAAIVLPLDGSVTALAIQLPATTVPEVPVAASTPPPAATRPSSPRLLTVRPGRRGVRVSWGAPVGSVTSYVVRIGSKHVALPATRRHVRITGLRPGRRFTVAVAARNTAGTGPRATAQFATRPR